MFTLEQDIIDFINNFNDCEVKYLIIGGYSVIIYGYSRTAMLAVKGLDFNHAFANSKRIETNGLTLNVISKKRFNCGKESIRQA